METFLEIKPHLVKNSALALGFFDGVHPGHQSVIRTAVAEAKALGVTPALITFKEHPRALTLGKSPPLLTLPEQRLELCEQMGIEAVLLLSFTEKLCRLAPEDYVRQVLVECMGARSLSVGYNHRFGRNREGDPGLLRELGKNMNFSVHVAGEVLMDGTEISSSRIREALGAGSIELANKLLGRLYSVPGVVGRGDGRGRTIGFPTANLASAPELILPARGVYSGYCVLEQGTSHPCVINIGLRPTFGDHLAPATEVHILDFDRELYGSNITVRFSRFIRAERKFDGVESLVKQITADCELAGRQLAEDSMVAPDPAGSFS
ncbi:MAG: bifunctional riboflavin kinase/FAD synthetase [Candidatus Obscuribacterales bacterium]|nr:bifunctional riboflavin kinase/FAD synthetase [Candidatus Obscuribacterales bacterium]